MRGRGRIGIGRRLATVATAVVAVALVAVGGSLLPVQSATFRTTPVPVVGRTAAICSTASESGTTATVAAVAIRSAPGRIGRLVGTALGESDPLISITEQGKGASERAPSTPVVLRGEGVMAIAGSGMLVSAASEESATELMAAPCTPPGTQHWFVGVGAQEDYRTDLMLTNPDAGDAEVDLRFYGPQGIVVVPGSPGLVVEGRSTRTVSLDSLVRTEGPLTISVRSSQGRVSAMTLNRRSDGLDPAGADWQPSSVAPTRSLVIPGVPEGDGTRDLVVVNPGAVRATVTVAALGIEGAYAPSGAETLEVAAESTLTVSLTAGLAAEEGAVQLTSDQPVTAAVQSQATRTDAQPDLAVQPAVGPVVRSGVVAAAVVDGMESEVVLSNGGGADVQLSIEVLSYDGVTLQSDDLLLVSGGTASRRLTASAPAYLVVRVPSDSMVFGGVSYRQPEGPVAGLATVPVTSPDVASRAPRTVPDPGVGR